MLNPYIEDSLLRERTILLSGYIEVESAHDIVGQLLYLDSLSDEPIYLFLNTGGGDVVSGFYIIDTMRYIRSDVCTICGGQAASMGAVLLSSGKRGKRYAFPNSTVMIHQPRGSMPKSPESDIEIHTQKIRDTKERLIYTLSKSTGKPYEILEQDMDRDYFLTAQQALEYGLVDKII